MTMDVQPNLWFIGATGIQTIHRMPLEASDQVVTALSPLANRE
jgi:hypothetical protein